MSNTGKIPQDFSQGKSCSQDFFELAPEKFQNKTNGVTPRRWLAMCNPPMRALLTQTLGSNDWVTDLNMLQVQRLKSI